MTRQKTRKQRGAGFFNFLRPVFFKDPSLPKKTSRRTWLNWIRGRPEPTSPTVLLTPLGKNMPKNTTSYELLSATPVQKTVTSNVAPKRTAAQAYMANTAAINQMPSLPNSPPLSAQWRTKIAEGNVPYMGVNYMGKTPLPNYTTHPIPQTGSRRNRRNRKTQRRRRL